MKKTGGWEDGDDGNESGSGLLPPEITVNASGQHYIQYTHVCMYRHIICCTMYIHVYWD